MNIVPVSTVLNEAGFWPPTLDALIPNERNYTVLLMQPRGQIEATAAGVRNRDRDLARRQFDAFLHDARQDQADLAITPEYSMPWEILVNAIRTGTIPGPGKLWAIGCESIRYTELETVKEDLTPFAKVVYEALQADAERFTDPLAYVFRAPLTDSSSATGVVVLVQFKTFPMGDEDHFEVNALQRGTRIYQFGGDGTSLKLVSLICSDAFKLLDDDAMAIYDRALVIHIQLNAKPRQEQYRMYRDRLLRFQGDETELICLNWASGVEEWCGENAKSWNNISASAWYLKPDKFDDRDATLAANHRRGLYYTWLQTLYVHALFFNYKPATYLLQASKVAHISVPAAVSRRRGPQLVRTCIWDYATTAWVEQAAAEDGFTGIVAECGQAKEEIARIAESNPFEAERVLALCAGKIGHDDAWHKVRRLDSCAIDASEVIRRITFCQDTDRLAHDFRVARLRRCGNLWNILKTDVCLPPALADLKGDFRLEWVSDCPHQNVISAGGQRATVIYMGEEADETEIEAVAKRAAEYLNRGFSNPDESHDARQRLAVWYRDQSGEIKQHGLHSYTKYNRPGNVSEYDIGREE